MQVLTPNYKISEEDFDRVIASTRLKGNTINIARAVLVEGLDMVGVAKENGLTRQRVMAIRDRVFSAYLKDNMYPPDWERVSVCAPKPMLDQFLREVEQERINFYSKKN